MEIVAQRADRARAQRRTAHDGCVALHDAKDIRRTAQTYAANRRIQFDHPDAGFNRVERRAAAANGFDRRGHSDSALAIGQYN